MLYVIFSQLEGARANTGLRVAVSSHCIVMIGPYRPKSESSKLLWNVGQNVTRYLQAGKILQARKTQLHTLTNVCSIMWI